MNKFETERLILRKWTFSDVDDLHEYGKSELVGPFAGWKPHADEKESIEIIKMFMKEDYTLAIELKETGKVIGGVALYDRVEDEKGKDLKQLEIGYVLNPEFWGNGYVPEAVECLKHYVFNDLNIDVLWCGHFDFNNNSKRVNEKCGFEYRFTKKQVLRLLDNKKVNTLFYSITNLQKKINFI